VHEASDDLAVVHVALSEAHYTMEALQVGIVDLGAEVSVVDLGAVVGVVDLGALVGLMDLSGAHTALSEAHYTMVALQVRLMDTYTNGPGSSIKCSRPVGSIRTSGPGGSSRTSGPGGNSRTRIGIG
jgi:hypothetical protein